MTVPEHSTADETDTGGARARAQRPGIVVLHSETAPLVRCLALEAGKLVVGRDRPELSDLPDARLSREHAEITLSRGRFSVRDLGSRNGTWVDAARADGTTTKDTMRVVRTGHTLFMPVLDITPFERLTSLRDGPHVIGPTTRAALEAIARTGDARTLLIRGETGSGKELAASTFHTRSPRPNGPMLSLNCAAIPEGLAERVLFGSTRGAFSGATDASGYIVDAHGGTLFLDEIAELHPQVQAKLLRAVEQQEVTALGATRSKKIDVRFCFATAKDLRALVTAGEFRQDLYYRIAKPEVVLAPLRERVEEIPWLLAMASLPAHAKLVELCMTRPWPGNVRELLRESAVAAENARSTGSPCVRPEHLDPSAGEALAEASAIDKKTLEDALARHGSVAAAARALDVHRTQLYRWMDRFGIKI